MRALLLLCVLAAVGCGSVTPAATDGPGGAAGDQVTAGASGSSGGADARGGSQGGAAGGSAGAQSLGGQGGATAGATGMAGAAGGVTGAGGTAGGPGTISDATCPSDFVVHAGCTADGGQLFIKGISCDVCHDGSGALLRCRFDLPAGSSGYCVPDCGACVAP